MSNVCSVCNEQLHKPATLDPCRHRICGRCVFDWIRLDNRQCPECRQPFLRATRTFPLLFSDLEDLEEAQVEWSMSGSASAVGSLISKRTCVSRTWKKGFVEFKAQRTKQSQMAEKEGSKDECLNQDPWWYGHVGREEFLVWRILGLWLLLAVLVAVCLFCSEPVFIFLRYIKSLKKQ